MLDCTSIHFIGIADGLKPLLILQALMDNPAFVSSCEGVRIHYITNASEGRVVSFCQEQGIEVITCDPKTMEASNGWGSDPFELLVSIGWSYMIPGEFLARFSRAAINCHGSLLPDYRGNNTYMHAYAQLADAYGATIHYMTEKFDDGKIIVQAAHKLYLEETPLIIHRRICEMTAQVLPEAMRLALEGYPGTRQTGTARYFYKIDRFEMERLRQANIEHLRAGEPLELARHKAWEL